MSGTRLHLLIATILGISCASPQLALAQNADSSGPSVIGTTVIGSKRVQLLSNNTWRFEETAPGSEGCVPINSVLSFCGSILKWRPTATHGTEFLRLFQHDTRNYGGIIYEEIGMDDGLDLDNLRAIIIENAALFSSVPVEEIPVLNVVDTSVDDVPGETITYGVRVNGLSFVYQNTIVSGARTSIQFVTWGIGQELSDDMQSLHANFIESLQLDMPGGRL